MSNLGLYQWMTTTSKKIGGPLPFMGALLGIGAAVTKTIDIVSERISAAREEKKKNEEAAIIHKVTCDGKSNEGLTFKVGEEFRVLTRDGDAVLIEKIGSQNNPYFVSAKFLSSISDYDIS